MEAKPIAGVAELLPEMKSWMCHIHANPEVSTQEHDTAKYIAALLRQWGYEVCEHVGKNGIEGLVASMRHGDGKKSIGIRADMDALPMTETNNLPYKSKDDRVSHLCGHDGHSAMALGVLQFKIHNSQFIIGLRVGNS